MREIKFRGKSIQGDWRFGSLVITAPKSYHIVEINRGHLLDDDMIEDGHHICQYSDRPTWVKEETIGQYTGLKDVNGKEVYEGDVIKLIDNEFYPHFYVVGWANCGFGLLFDKEDKYIRQLDEDNVTEIVGNIYNNSELMKGE